jgi:exopolysaccharide production protein ExoQ
LQAWKWVATRTQQAVGIEPGFRHLEQAVPIGRELVESESARMNNSLATLVYACGIGGLFYLDRDKSVRTSGALWLPIAYLWIVARALSVWLGIASPANIQLDGSPLDAAVLSLLLAAAAVVLFQRSRLTGALLAANWPILIFYAYCLVSVTWSYYPDIAFKRWIKAIEDLVMVLVIVTDRQPVAAVRRVFSRAGFLLLPVSVLYIKYFPALGRGYTPDGLPMNRGVTTDKNTLGQIVLVISLVVLWNVLTLLQDKQAPNRTRRLIAQVTLLAFGAVLLQMADSSTSLACFVLGAGIMLAARSRAMKRRPARVHGLAVGILLAGALIILFGGQSTVTDTLGRQSNFSGRTDIWAAAISAGSNPIIGDGMDNFWIGPHVRKLQSTLANAGWWHPEGLNEAHNGYIEIYLNLGWIGVCLIAVVLIRGYTRAAGAFRMNPATGGPLLGYVFVAAFYSIAEAGFRSPTYMQIFLLLAIFSASAFSGALLGVEKAKVPVSSRGRSYATGAIY